MSNSPDALAGDSYRTRVAKEQRTYESAAGTSELPEAFHYWSNRHIRPKLLELGYSSDRDFLLQNLRRCLLTDDGPKRFASFGAGDGAAEIELALALREQNGDFVIECFDMNRTLIERGRALAAVHGLHQVRFEEADLNYWTAVRSYDGCIANQSLHHVLGLERLLDQVKQSLRPRAPFLICDIAGRNGHLRWPEALQMVRGLWPKLPPSYRYNHQVKRYEEMFEDWDCSKEGFEGIRCQDILALLVERFQFHFFFGFANVIEPFVDRSFGPNFDMGNDWDRSFIDEVHSLDQQSILCGHLQPTHIVAACCDTPADTPLYYPREPRFCMRSPGEPAPAPEPPQSLYLWNEWPHDLRRELELACLRLSEYEVRHRELHKQWEESQQLILRFSAELERMNGLFEERTEWACSLKAEVEDLTALCKQQGEEMERRTAWAIERDKEVARLGALLEERAAEAYQRTDWALRLDAEVARLTLLLQEHRREIERSRQPGWRRLLGR